MIKSNVKRSGAGVMMLTFLLIIPMLFEGCSGGKRRVDADISGVDLPQMTIRRYDLDLFKANTSRLQQELERLKPAYRFFLGTDLNDTAKLRSMQDYLANPRNQGFFAAVDSGEAKASRGSRYCLK